MLLELNRRDDAHLRHGGPRRAIAPARRRAAVGAAGGVVGRVPPHPPTAGEPGGRPDPVRAPLRRVRWGRHPARSWSAEGRHSEHRRREHIELVAAVLAVAAMIGFGIELAVHDATTNHADAERPPAAVPEDVGTASAVEVVAADAGATATRAKVRAALPAEKLPPELAATISTMVTAAHGCTNTVLGETIVTATHCHQPGFVTNGDVAWAGPEPEWVDPGTVPIGATIYAVGYPQATPGAQQFTLSNLGTRTIVIERNPQLVLMAVGEGVPCTSGASGMVGWVTLDGVMRPIGPLSVFATEPSITGLPLGQYVCGFAVAATIGGS